MRSGWVVIVNWVSGKQTRRVFYNYNQAKQVKNGLQYRLGVDEVYLTRKGY